MTLKNDTSQKIGNHKIAHKDSESELRFDRGVIDGDQNFVRFFKKEKFQQNIRKILFLRQKMY